MRKTLNVMRVLSKRPKNFRQDEQDHKDIDVEHKKLTEKIIGCAMAVHRALGPGFLESVYQNALAHEMRKADLGVECEKKIQVTYDRIVVGEFSADMLVQSVVLVENKAVQKLIPAHEVQLVNYLTATGIEIGLLLNFGSERLEFKRKTRTYQPKGLRQDEQQKGFRQDLQDGQDEQRLRQQSCSNPVDPVHPV